MQVQVSVPTGISFLAENGPPEADAAFAIVDVRRVVDIVGSIQPAIVNMYFVEPTKLAKLSLLEDGWDDEGAPRPSLDAIRRADRALDWASQSGLMVSDVGPDVLGGVGIWLRSFSNYNARAAWIACMNNGHDTIVLSENGAVVGHAPWDAGDDRPKATVKAFLAGNQRAAAA